MLRAIASTPGLALAAALALAPAGCESDHTFYDVAGDTAEVVDTDDEADGEVEVTGTASCAQVLTCLQACTDTPCIDTCRGTVCPANATQLDALMTCVTDHCAAECADFTASGCMTCVTGACMTEAGACYGATCG